LGQEAAGGDLQALDWSRRPCGLFVALDFERADEAWTCSFKPIFFVVKIAYISNLIRRQCFDNKE
jgi:hypothetical protein